MRACEHPAERPHGPHEITADPHDLQGSRRGATALPGRVPALIPGIIRTSRLPGQTGAMGAPCLSVQRTALARRAAGALPGDHVGPRPRLTRRAACWRPGLRASSGWGSGVLRRFCPADGLRSIRERGRRRLPWAGWAGPRGRIHMAELAHGGDGLDFRHEHPAQVFVIRGAVGPYGRVLAGRDLAVPHIRREETVPECAVLGPAVRPSA